ncbi:Alkaline shock protein 23 [Caloramator mitchellensis]|uniref:Alkaline shock protein 23 n=1 Tax=Caloramator mitchellensis TaxID=908809 RepID=A0A0R3JTH6_CALMK|nr:Asp23/Gls24 family envelope stress response protein [Caloramator mitchellensis]KRQ86835.1 Alkaline shock protein 23 [Caloramator mitchellensis]
MEGEMNLNEFGQIKIAPEVISLIASMAVNEVSGVADLTGGFTGDMLEKVGVKSPAKGIKVQLGENEVLIDANIVVDYGVSIPEVAKEVQKKVKLSVETMTGITVTQVNVHVQGVNFQKEVKDEEKVKK